MKYGLLCIALLPHLLAMSARAEEPKAKKVLIIGLDGVRTDALDVAITPNFDKLVKQGAWAKNTDILAKRYDSNFTLSGPGWSNILTGVWPDKHKVNDNQFRNADYKRYPHLFARLKQARPQTRAASIVDWAPLHEQIPSSADIEKTIKSTKDLDRRADAEVSRVACGVLEKEDVDVVFVYFAQIDDHGHEHGFHPAVKDYLAAIERVDEHIGQLVEAIHARKSYAQEDWLIIATTDHGGQGKDHKDGREVPEIRIVWLLVSGPGVKRGTLETPTAQADVAPTVLTYLGVRIDPDWGWDGHAVGLKK